MLQTVSSPDSFPQVLTAGNMASSRKCYVCGSPDHMQRDCPQFKRSINYMKRNFQKRMDGARSNAPRNGDKFSRPSATVSKDASRSFKKPAPRSQANAATCQPDPSMDQGDEDDLDDTFDQMSYFANTAQASSPSASSSSSVDFFALFDEIANGESV